ncbi:unnamed protein product [Malassezia sympodialis ATCC 42132]|uniref:Similar to S.cerevisiae protein SEC14 (Phosphatidylinositol/phosphatidylcholine transfer protein) n=1 Tax=Malassezia sympodialis (strain ATCC 42132) TaxID=1230383 RepID=M5EA79_MALS4|nr:uncharacterized protein MSY001_2412 [Malassezia sympodialis ATCC 42132]CCU99706.1 unnamed protein product [Malassezia sympodialis ATCC 42132]SHO76811.1 Similar to S.cerevisiae protein SEC14 (Phosphatidylinositol/phosphatidylcholine transfer protein) [Malassezia sympodialis ATCC 42132]|eukprot:XP_018740939.1 uncharacterized protein MSY001_2412 [Malassezia sympodialis ATCC 42132]
MSTPRRSFANIFGDALGVPSGDGRSGGSGRSSRRNSDQGKSSLQTYVTPPGHQGNLSVDQQKALDAISKQLEEAGAISLRNPPHYQEAQLLRFLRARNFDVEASREMYLRAEEWKKKINLDHLYSEFRFTERDDVAKFGWRMYFHKTDTAGRPIFIQDLSGLDAEKVFSVTTPDRIIQNFAVTLEHAVRRRYYACTKAQGHNVDDNFMVLNVQGLGLGQFWTMKNKLQELLSILDNNFPELSGRVHIINAPFIFSTAWACIKGWLPAHTAEKINICGADYLPIISQYVNLENWPAHLGGRCKCSHDSPQHACETKDFGPWNQ